jgi:prolyl-tRNA synthetase
MTTSSATAKKECKLGVDAKKSEDMSTWYTQVLLRAEMMDYHDVSGCYILRPWSMAIWKHIQQFFTREIEKLGVQEAYFPLFISQHALQREKEHVEGFAPEVAWVTRSGSSDLPEPIAVRPTSETIMYPAYAKWIQSKRDLPLRLNQWCNVVRWEFKHPQPFLRSREFLWQEGHTVFLRKDEADSEVLQILDLYAQIYQDLLAVPVIKGRKTDVEKFAGALYTTTVETFLPCAGRGVQGGTSHCLGQNFSRMFDIRVESDERPGEHDYVWQNSWGFTTRSIGVTTMIHADDNGMVLPPRVAAVQVVIVPVGITAKMGEQEAQGIIEKTVQLASDLRQAGIRCEADLRDNVTPGWKFNHWELKGVPLRLELGPKDVQQGTVRCVRRYDGHKSDLPLAGISAAIAQSLDQVHEGMLRKATQERDQHVRVLEDSQTFDDFCRLLSAKCAVMVPFCEDGDCEHSIKERSASWTAAKAQQDDQGAEDAKAPSMGAKSLCIPFKQPRALSAGQQCLGGCGRPAKSFTLFGRTY